MASTPLSLDAELSIFTAAAVKMQLLSALEAADDLSLDLSAVCEVDTAGLQLLVALQQEARQRGKTVKVCGMSRELAEAAALFDLTSRLGVTAETGKDAR